MTLNDVVVCLLYPLRPSLTLEMELENPNRTNKRSRENKFKWRNLTNEEFELKYITQVGETIENNWDGSTYCSVMCFLLPLPLGTEPVVTPHGVRY